MPAPKKNSHKPTKEILKRSETLKTKKKVGKFIILTTLGVVVLSALVYLLYVPALSIRSIAVQGNNILDVADIQSVVEQRLAGNYLYFFPKRSIFIYPKKDIVENLQTQFPRLSSFEVGIGNYDSLVIDIKERDSDAIWCNDGESPRDVLGQVIDPEVDDSSQATSSESEVYRAGDSAQNCYFSDLTGFVFAPAPYFSNSVFMELSGLLGEQPIGTAPLSPASYSTVTNFSKNLAKIFNKTNNDQYRLIKAAIIDKNNYEAIIADTSKSVNNEWKIFFDSDDSADELINNFLTVLDSESFKKQMIANKGNLASIDLRYGKKVFYKFKN